MRGHSSKGSRLSLGSTWVLFLLALGSREVYACAACFGAPDSPMTQGLNMGIFSLLVVVLMVLGGAAAFFIFLARRAGSAIEMGSRTGVSDSGEGSGKTE